MNYVLQLVKQVVDLLYHGSNYFIDRISCACKHGNTHSTSVTCTCRGAASTRWSHGALILTYVQWVGMPSNWPSWYDEITVTAAAYTGPGWQQCRYS